MKLYTLNFTQTLPLSIDEAWRCFCDPRNLSIITPAWLDFQMTGELPERMDAGLVLSYRIRPFLGFPVNWISEITHVREPEMFVDEQRFGPYRFWHHQHHFRETPAGVEVRDIVNYGLKFGLFGRVTNAVLVRRRIDEIFAFRRQELERRFNAPALNKV